MTRGVAERDRGRDPYAGVVRPSIIDPWRAKLEELVDRSEGKVRADVVHERLVAMGFAGSQRTTRRAVADAKASWCAGRRRVYRPWVVEPGMWLQFDWGWRRHVTLTHTAGVLILGLLRNPGSAVAGEAMLERLSLLSGVMIAGIGATLVLDAMRARRRLNDGFDFRHRHTDPVAVEGTGADRILVHGGTDGQAQGDAHDHHHPQHDPRFSRRGLVGMGWRADSCPALGTCRPVGICRTRSHDVRGVTRPRLRTGHGHDTGHRRPGAGPLPQPTGPRETERALGSMLHGVAAWVPIATAGLVLLVGVG